MVRTSCAAQVQAVPLNMCDLGTKKHGSSLIPSHRVPKQSLDCPQDKACLKPKLEVSSSIAGRSLAERDLPEALHKVWAIAFSRCFINRECVTHQRNLAKLQLVFGWRTVWQSPFIYCVSQWYLVLIDQQQQ